MENPEQAFLQLWPRRLSGASPAPNLRGRRTLPAWSARPQPRFSSVPALLAPCLLLQARGPAGPGQRSSCSAARQQP